MVILRTYFKSLISLGKSVINFLNLKRSTMYSSDTIIKEDLLHAASLDSIYKYICAENGILFLNNCQLRFNTPLNFNDPFDCDHSMIEIGEDYILKTMRNDKNYSRITSNKNFPKSSIYQNAIADFRDKKGDTIRENILSRVGITCFSEKKHNVLMWAHYAKNHTGICIDFDVKKLIIYLSQISKLDKAKSGIFLKVQYDEVRGNYMYGLDNNVGTLLMWLKTKSKDWEYEKELRLTLLNWDATHIPIPVSIIHAIYLGSKITPVNEAEIKNICSMKFPNVPLYKMKLSDREFTLIESPIVK